MTYSFNTYKKTIPYYSLIEAKTGMPIRNFYCITEASIVLGVKNIFILKEKVEQSTPIHSPNYPFPVLLISLAPIHPSPSRSLV